MSLPAPTAVRIGLTAIRAALDAHDIPQAREQLAFTEAQLGFYLAKLETETVPIAALRAFARQTEGQR